MPHKLTEDEFDMLDIQIKGITKQIKILVRSKAENFKVFGITKQAYHHRLKKRKEAAK